MYTCNGRSDFQDCINDKIKLLRQFGVLKSKATKQTKAVRKILARCQNDLQLDIKVRDLITDKITLEQFIAKEELKCKN